MVIGRGRRREHLKDTSKGVTTGVAQLPAAHARIQGNPEGIKWPSVTPGSHVTTVLLLRKKTREKPGMSRTYFGQGHFWTEPLPITWLTSLRIKEATLGRYYANSGQGTWLASLLVTWLTSLPVTWLPVAPPHRSTANATLSVPIYYSRVLYNNASALLTRGKLLHGCCSSLRDECFGPMILVQPHPCLLKCLYQSRVVSGDVSEGYRFCLYDFSLGFWTCSDIVCSMFYISFYFRKINLIYKWIHLYSKKYMFYWRNLHCGGIVLVLM
jgi:hypothetical protein